MAKRVKGFGKINIQVLGDKELEEVFAALHNEEAYKIFRGALRKATVPVFNSAKALVPTDSGWLLGTIRLLVSKKKVRKGGGRQTISAIVRAGSNDINWYVGHVELGTSKKPPVPFLRNSLKLGKGEVLSILTRELWVGIKKLAKKKERAATRHLKQGG